MTDDMGWGRVMLGLEGFAVTGVELVAGEAVGRPGCGVLASVHS